MKPKNLHLASSLAELNNLCATPGLKRVPISRLVTSADKVYAKAKVTDSERDEEEAYKLYSTYYSVFKEITSREEYKKDKKYYNQCINIKRSAEVITRMEELSQSLEKRYSLISAALQAEEDESKRLQQKEAAAEKEEQKAKEKTSQPLMNGVQNISPADGMLSIESLRTLITQQSTSFLLLDVRPAQHYALSHAKLPQSINIPEHILRKGLTAGAVSDHLDPDARMQWNRRGKVDCLILMDWNCEGPPFPKSIVALRDAITEWDPSTNYKCESPVVLKGGYEYLILSYPMYVTNPKVASPQPVGVGANGPSASPIPSLDFQYPDLDTTFIQSPPALQPLVQPAPPGDAAAPAGAGGPQTLSVSDPPRPAASPQMTPRPLDSISHPVFPTSPAHKKTPAPTFNRSLKPQDAAGLKPIPNGVLPQLQQPEPSTNGLAGPRASPELSGGLGPLTLEPRSNGLRNLGHNSGPTSANLSSNGLFKPNASSKSVDTLGKDKGKLNGNSMSVDTLGKDKGKPNGNSKSVDTLGKDKVSRGPVMPRVPSRSLKPFDLLNSLATDNIIEERRLLEEKINNDEMALEKLSALERQDSTAAATQQLRQELEVLHTSSARMEEALARISRENTDLWRCINSFVNNNHDNSVVDNASPPTGLPNGSLPHLTPSLPPHRLPPLQPPVHPMQDVGTPELDEKMLKEVLETKKTAHEDLLAKVDELRKLRKEKETQMKLQPLPDKREGPRTYRAPLQDSPRHSPDAGDSRGSTNLRRSHSAFDLSQMGESLPPSPQRPPEAPPSSASSAFRKSMASLRPSIDRTIKPLQAFAFRRPTTLNAARKRDFGPICRTRSHTGLKNLGNTCYMNSIVQCLSNTQPFAAYFVEERHTDYVNPNSPQRGEAAVEFGEVVKALKSGKYQSVAMKDFKVVVGKYNPEFRGCDQHDAHEFLMNIADWLHDDLNLVETKFPPMSEQNHSLTTPDHVAAQEVQTEIALRDNSIVRKLFYGLHRNVITCLTCETRSLTFEPFFVLTLSFPANGRCSLTDLLHHYYKESNIEYNCSKCRCLRECIRKMDIWELPPVLIVHLNRFEQRDFLMTKNPNYVDFPLHHLMLERFVVDSPKAPSQNTDYSLYAVCNHYGTIDGGHYTAFCSSWPPGDSWHKYDDHEVYDLNCNNVKTSAAYVLFYQSSTYVTRSVHVH